MTTGRALVAMFVLSLGVLAVAARPAAAAVVEDPREVNARELFAAGRYNEALDVYIKLYAERPHPTYVRNIGRCYQNLGDADRAIASFREYLRQVPNLAPAQRALIEGYIAEMEQLERQRAARAAEPPAGSALLAPAAPATVVVGAPRAPAGANDGARRSPGAVPYVVAVASAASIGAGTYFGIRAISRRRASDRDCPDNRCSMEGVSLNEEAKTAAQYCDVTIGLGLVGAAVATYLFLRSPASDSSDGSAAGEGSHVAGARPLRVIPAVGPGVASLLLGGAW